jgi:hypothetical protein
MRYRLVAPQTQTGLPPAGGCVYESSALSTTWSLSHMGNGKESTNPPKNPGGGTGTGGNPGKGAGNGPKPPVGNDGNVKPDSIGDRPPQLRR